MSVSNPWNQGRKIRSVGLTLLLAVGLIGCGSSDGLDRRAVRGTATYEGEPIEKGTITLFPLANGIMAAGKIVDGHYEIPAHEGPIPGEYRVEVTALKETGRMLRNEEPGMETIEIPEVLSFIPAKYNDLSELTIEISQEEIATQADFRLEE
ncbi:carboxypeptidase-like regulatory domain-containing protein [Bremerella alba]|uniref:Carboxypeptidase regulatory-like domain-containing protein n=1 Tax=Bremerella alba TaxID=980252 RepID=A0A7V8V212_9BACT|nr:carboxypeptidase-like regulatory domain-containing protein [Bremerella alba]MBA2113464.1 hypothetical protein [Bremerella alba]